MDSLAQIVLLLQMALSLLTLAQSNSPLPVAAHDRVIQVAQEAIAKATVALSANNVSSGGSTSPSIRLTRSATVEIDQSSLRSSSGNPTIVGNATNTPSLAIFVYANDPAHRYDYGVYGPYPGVVTVQNNRWSYHLGVSGWSGATNLSPGSYTVDVREFTGSTPSGGQGLARLLTGRLLATAILVIYDSHNP